MQAMAVMVLGAVLLIGVLYFRLHSLPERMAHRNSSAQFQLVGILCLLALFTHNSLFWVGALMLAAVQLPDVTAPLRVMARALERLAGGAKERDDA